MIRLIIVDDEKIIRETIRSIVDWASIGVEVIGVCKDGIEAYDMILDEYPDIVMTDIKMPGLSGLELIQNISQTDLDIEYIILSGYDEFEFARTAMKYGVKYYLLKPCNEYEIMEVAKSCIEDCHNKQIIKFDSLIQDIFDHDHNVKENSKKKFIATFSSLTDKNFAKTVLIRLLMQYFSGDIGPENSLKMTRTIISLNRCTTMPEIIEQAEKIFSDIFNSSFEEDKNKDYIEKTQLYVKEHLSDTNLSLKWIAENYLFLSADYLSKQFVKETGCKFSTYLSQERISLAKKLIEEKIFDKAYEIAVAVGYENNPQYFSQIFKKYTCMTPTEYIKMIEDG